MTTICSPVSVALRPDLSPIPLGGNVQEQGELRVGQQPVIAPLRRTHKARSATMAVIEPGIRASIGLHLNRLRVFYAQSRLRLALGSSARLIRSISAISVGSAADVENSSFLGAYLVLGTT